MLNEGNSFGSAIRNKRLRKLLDDAGYQDVELVKGDGYLYVDAADGQHYDWLNALDSTSIYLNSFSQQSPEEWFNDIIVMLRKGRNAFIEKYPDGQIDEAIAKQNDDGTYDVDLDDDSGVRPPMTRGELIRFIARAVDIAASKLENKFWTQGMYNRAHEIRRMKGSVKDVYEIMADMWEEENITVYHYAYKNGKRIADDEVFSKHNNEFKNEEELASYIVKQIEKTKLTESVNEDFACGVGDVGLNQGIPHGGDGKGVVPTPMGEPVKKPKKKKKNLFRDYLSKYNV